MVTNRSVMKDSAFQDFSESALEALDFARCQRPDGSFYGTGGVCRKGSLTGDKEKEASKPKSKKPIDTGRMRTMTDKQLAQLAKREELDLSQKAAIANELKARKQASDDYDKSGMTARTEKAEKDRENFYVKKDGGFVPRAEKQMAIGDESYTGSDILRENLDFQKNAFGQLSDKQAMANLEHGNRLLKNGALKNEFDIFWENGGISLNKMIDGNWVQMTNTDGTIGWTVNKKYMLTDQPRKTRLKIALESRKMWETFTRSATDGSVLNTSAAFGDGRGASRTKAYQEMGFSKPRSQGADMYAKISKGNVVPSTKAEFFRGREKVNFEDAPLFAESFKQPTTKELDKLWQIITGL